MNTPSLAVSLPRGWHFLPAGSDAETWAAGVLATAGRPAHLSDRLRADLLRFAGPSLIAGRDGLVALHPDPALASRVLAAGWLEAGPALDVNELAERLRAARLPGAVLARDVQVRESRRVPAVTCRDLMTDPRDPQGAVLHERCAVVVVHRHLATSVRLELSTSDLAAFDDIVAVCLEVATRAEPAPAAGSGAR
jgi:hypothetical protein